MLDAPPIRLWTLTRGTRTARYDVDGELIRRQVVKDTPALECHGQGARDAFEAMGWPDPTGIADAKVFS